MIDISLGMHYLSEKGMIHRVSHFMVHFVSHLIHYEVKPGILEFLYDIPLFQMMRRKQRAIPHE